MAPKMSAEAISTCDAKASLPPLHVLCVLGTPRKAPPAKGRETWSEPLSATQSPHNTTFLHPCLDFIFSRPSHVSAWIPDVEEKVTETNNLPRPAPIFRFLWLQTRRTLQNAKAGSPTEHSVDVSRHWTTFRKSESLSLALSFPVFEHCFPTIGAIFPH